MRCNSSNRANYRTSNRQGTRSDCIPIKKDYLKNNGLASDKIVATSKGQTEPIANDTTEEGKDKNSRTVITLN